MPKPGPEAELSNFCSCPSHGQAHPPTTDQAANKVPEGRKTKEKHNSKCQKTLPDGNCHLLSASGFLSSKEPISGKLFRFPLQALAPALRDNSETPFPLLGLTSEPQGSPLLAKYGGFYSSLWSHICLLLQTGDLMRREMTLLVLSFPAADLKSYYSARTCHMCVFAAGPATRSWKLKSAFFLHPGPDLKPTEEHTV